MRHYITYLIAILAILGITYASQQPSFKTYGMQAYVSGSIQERAYSVTLTSWIGKNLPASLGGGEKSQPEAK